MIKHIKRTEISQNVPEGMPEQGEYEVILYDSPNGTEPVADFINSLSKKMAAKVLWTIALLEEDGPTLREPYSQSLGDGIFELRIKVGSNITRVLYFFMIGKKIILTHGFVKKTQKTPLGEINKAKRYRSDYLSRSEYLS